MPDWEPYQPFGEDYVSVSRWGKDHWSTFAYLETRTVDYGGMIENRHLRCCPRLHRAFAHSANGGNYPTRLRGNETVADHDDWSCVEDMVAAGLVYCEWDRPFGGPTGGKARVRLTPQGLEMAALLRAYKANDGNFHAFSDYLETEGLLAKERPE